MKSIISNDRECYICKTTLDLHKHHIFFGNPNRRHSEEYGCWVYLCARHHMSDAGVHFNHELDMYLKRIAQERFEQTFDVPFIQVFHRNYKEIKND